MTAALERIFHLRELGTTPATEVRAGAVTFLTLAYILFVNPQILSRAGLPAEDVVIATALASAAGTLVMGLAANYPFALAPGMGLNAYFAYGVVEKLGVDWRAALAAVLVAGLLFLVLALGGVRRALVSAIPGPIKLATMSGIGLFLAAIGFQNAGLVRADAATLTALGDLKDPQVLLFLALLVLVAVLLTLRVRGAILLGIGAGTAAAWALGLTPVPAALLSLPRLPRETLWAFDFGALGSGSMLAVIGAFLFVDLFDTAGTLMGVGRLGGFLDARGELPRADRAFAADAFGTTLGAALGTSPVTSYIESATGVEEGGRSGLTAVVVAVLFAASLFFIPLLASVPTVATAPALVVVGALMLAGAREIDWQRVDEALPAFLTITVMPFTFSIANGISLGIGSWVAIRVLAGRHREVPALLYLLCGLLVLYYGWL